MALTTRYFAPAAAGSGDGTSVANAAALFTGGAWSSVITGFAFNGPGGLECRITPGTYTITAALASGSFTSGTPSATAPLIFHGADASGNRLAPPNPAWTSDQPLWDTSGLPLLQSASNIAMFTSIVTLARLLRCAGSAVTSAAVLSPFALNWCYVLNSNNNANAIGCITRFAANSWIECSASSYLQCLHNGTQSGGTIYRNVRCKGPTGSSGVRRGISADDFAGPLVVTDCTVTGVGGNGIHIAETSTSSFAHVARSVVANVGGIGVRLSTVASPTVATYVSKCIITGTGGVGIDAGNSSAIITECRLRDNTGGAISNAGNWPADIDALTTAGTDAAEYNNTASDDFRILASASFANRNIGVSQMAAANRSAWDGGYGA